jgi:hypothetical protein
MTDLPVKEKQGGYCETTPNLFDPDKVIKALARFEVKAVDEK